MKLRQVRDAAVVAIGLACACAFEIWAVRAFALPHIRDLSKAQLGIIGLSMLAGLSSPMLLPLLWKSGSPLSKTSAVWLVLVLTAITSSLAYVVIQRGVWSDQAKLVADASGAGTLLPIYRGAVYVRRYCSLNMLFEILIGAAILGKAITRHERSRGGNWPAFLLIVVGTTIVLLITAFGGLSFGVWQWGLQYLCSLESLDVLHQIREKLLSVAVVSCGAIALVTGMSKRPLPRLRAYAIAIFGLGCLAFVATRPLAHDAEHGVVLPDNVAPYDFAGMPILQLDKAGREVGVRRDEGATPLERLSALRAQWRQNLMSLPPTLFVVADPQMSADLVTPYLEAARFVGFDEVVSWVHVSARLTETLGAVSPLQMGTTGAVGI